MIELERKRGLPSRRLAEWEQVGPRRWVRARECGVK